MNASNQHLCRFCGVDLEDALGDLAPDDDHASDCPVNTDIWPVEQSDLTHGLRCMDCKSELAMGDSYTHRRVEFDVYDIVCLGCGVLNPSEYV